MTYNCNAGPSASFINQSLLTVLPGMGARNVLGLGVDLLDARRVEKLALRYSERFAKRLLSCREYTDWLKKERSSRFLAKQFAAKEAMAKALGTGIAKGVGFTQLQVYRDGFGAPYAELEGEAATRLKALGGRTLKISLSDEGAWIIAVAMISQ